MINMEKREKKRSWRILRRAQHLPVGSKETDKNLGPWDGDYD
jgi:hypothetical protein